MLRAPLKTLGDAMQRHHRAILTLQWVIVAAYLFLVITPAFYTLPPEDARLWNNLTLFAQFAFWGIWWPFVMVSMIVLGRAWCGVFCPEGALTEFASRHGLQRSIPNWIRWSGWPFVSFLGTTLYGQLVSVYEYPKAALLVLGGSTVAAVIIGFLYGRGVRVWCRFLCPANGVFMLLSRLAPVHFRVNLPAWQQYGNPSVAVNCPPLLDVKHMAGTGACHACGRCSSHRDAVALSLRSPHEEILELKKDAHTHWEITTLIVGVLGIAMGAFQWSASPWFIRLKQMLAESAIAHDQLWLLKDNAPWWLLTHYPEVNDVFTWIDGLAILVYIALFTVIMSAWLVSWLWLSGRMMQGRVPFWRLAYMLTPMAGISIFLGLSMLTIGQLRTMHIAWTWLPYARGVLLSIGLLWSLHLGWRLLASVPLSYARKSLALSCCTLALLGILTSWIWVFYIW